MIFLNSLNKKGTEKVVSVYWFTILVLVAGGIWAMTNAYYNHPYDIREIEARVLSNQVADCLSQKGILNSNLFDANGNLRDKIGFDLAMECHLNLQVEAVFGDKRQQYYIEINFSDINKNLLSVNSIGEPSIRSDCVNIQKVETYQLASKCSIERLYSTYNGKQFLIEIFTGVKKTEKNVKF